MDWTVLVLSGLMESVWAIALEKSAGFSNPAAVAVFVCGLALSMAGLGFAVKTLPIGVAYAVWTGIGVVSTSIYSMATGAEPTSVLKVLLVLGLVGCIAGLRVTS